MSVNKKGIEMSDILCVGQMVVDILVQNVDEVDFNVDTKRVDQILMQNGGDCLNTVIDLKKLGADVGVSGVLGRDPMGEFLYGILKENCIDTGGICFDDSSKTSSVVGLINKSGERVFLFSGVSTDALTFETVAGGLVENARIVHVGGTYMLPGFDGEGARKLFSLAHKTGAFTTMDVTWDTTGRWLETIKPCLSELDLFIPSINEAKEICGTEDEREIAAFLKDRGVKNVMVKLGGRGCYVDAFGRQYYQRAYKVPVVDTTGAGDSFVAGVLYGLSQRWEPEEITRFASAVSAHCIQKLGATAGVPSYDSVIDFIKNAE